MSELRTELRDEELSTVDMATAGDEPVTGQERRPEGMARPSAPAEAPPAPAGAGAASAKESRSTPLFAAPEAQELRSNWESTQTEFVDNPRRSVEQADHLVAQTIKRLAEVFADERNRLERQWSRGDNVSTEDLRVALQRYRSFFDRLLSF